MPKIVTQPLYGAVIFTIILMGQSAVASAVCIKWMKTVETATPEALLITEMTDIVKSVGGSTDIYSRTAALQQLKRLDATIVERKNILRETLFIAEREYPKDDSWIERFTN